MHLPELLHNVSVFAWLGFWSLVMIVFSMGFYYDSYLPLWTLTLLCSIVGYTVAHGLQGDKLAITRRFALGVMMLIYVVFFVRLYGDSFLPF